MSKTAFLAVWLFALTLCASSCGASDVTPVIAGAPSRPAEASAAGSAGGEGAASSGFSRTPSAGSVPGASGESRGQASRFAVSSGGRSGGAGNASSNPSSGESKPGPVSSADRTPQSSSSAASQDRAEIADRNLRKYLNGKYFGRPGDADTQPYRSEMQSLDTEISIGEDVGIRSLRGIESASNIQLLNVRYNPVETLSDVDWSRFGQLTELILICSKVKNLEHVNWNKNKLENLTVAGAGGAGLRGELTGVEGPDWADFTALKRLDFQYNRIENPSPLNLAFAGITFLNLDYNPISASAANTFRRGFLQKNPGAGLSILLTPDFT